MGNDKVVNGRTWGSLILFGGIEQNIREGDEGQRNKIISLSSEREVPNAFFRAAFLICLKELIHFRKRSGLYCLRADHTNERSILRRSLFYIQACITCRPIIKTGLHYIQASAKGRSMLHNNKLLLFVLRISREIHTNTQRIEPKTDRIQNRHHTAPTFVQCIIVHCITVVAARSRAWVCDRSPAGFACSNPAGDMDVCLLWVSCVVVRLGPLRRTDCPSRGVLLIVMCLSVNLEASVIRGPGPLGVVTP
jgi:hypothetical protein